MASDDSLVCNFKKCRKRLNTFAWATSCSHVFCDEDGTREFNKSCVCPACDTQLPGKYDIVRVDLQPSEEYKSMVLAGQRPETIMEITSRALSFWTYQAHQERTYHEYCSTKAKERLQQVETYYEQLQTRTQAELASVKAQVEALHKELEATKFKYNESSEKLLEKSRQYQKLQSMYDSLRRRSVTLASFEGSENHPLPLHYNRPQKASIEYQQAASNDYQPQQTSRSGSGIPLAVSTSSNVTQATTNATQQVVDPLLAAAVNVGAFRQSNAVIKPNKSGDQFMLELATNPSSHK